MLSLWKVHCFRGFVHRQNNRLPANASTRFFYHRRSTCSVVFSSQTNKVPMVYLPTFYHINQPNVGKYTIHGSYGFIWLCTFTSLYYHHHFGYPIHQTNSCHIVWLIKHQKLVDFPMSETAFIVTIVLDIHSSNFHGAEPNLRSKTIISLSSSETRSFVWWGQLEWWSGWGDRLKVVFLTSEFVKLKPFFPYHLRLWNWITFSYRHFEYIYIYIYNIYIYNIYII